MKTYDPKEQLQKTSALLPWNTPELSVLSFHSIQGGAGSLPETNGGFWNDDGDVPCCS
jgi:hypothetical protein